MEKLRIISDNVVDSATITASSTAGSLSANNLKNNKKSSVWRSVGNTATLTISLQAAKLVNGSVVAFTNLSSQSTLRVRLYTNASDSSPIYDSGSKLAAPPKPLGTFTWGEPLGENAYSGEIPLGVNNFSRGRFSYGRVWADKTYLVQKIVIDIFDASLSYIEVGKLIIGNSWTPSSGASVGNTSVSQDDSSSNVRSESGDVFVDTGYVHKNITFDLPHLPPDERNYIWKVLRNSSSVKPVFVSLFPNNSDSLLEQTFMVYGYLPSNGNLNIPYYNRFKTDFKLEEV